MTSQLLAGRPCRVSPRQVPARKRRRPRDRVTHSREVTEGRDGANTTRPSLAGERGPEANSVLQDVGSIPRTFQNAFTWLGGEAPDQARPRGWAPHLPDHLLCPPGGTRLHNLCPFCGYRGPVPSPPAMGASLLPGLRVDEAGVWQPFVPHVSLAALSSLPSVTESHPCHLPPVFAALSPACQHLSLVQGSLLPGFSAPVCFCSVAGRPPPARPSLTPIQP